MYIDKRKVKNGIKYYLAHSFREGGKVHKIRKLLGVNLLFEELQKRKEQIKKLILEEISRYKIIKDPLHDKLSDEEIKFIKNLEIKTVPKISHLSKEQWSIFSEIFTFNTNAIEGSELNSKEVKEIIEEDKWPDKSKEDVAEAYGVNEALAFVRDTKESLSINFIKKLHKIIFKNSKFFAGEFRKAGEEVVIRNQLGEIIHEGAPQSRVVSLLKELIDWYNLYKNEYPGLILASVIHNQFENIHPFRDGNGRVGRLLLNYVLLKNNLPPVNISLRNRKEYYESLRAYDKEHNIRPAIELILKEYKDLKKLFNK